MQGEIIHVYVEYMMFNGRMETIMKSCRPYDTIKSLRSDLDIQEPLCLLRGSVINELMSVTYYGIKDGEKITLLPPGIVKNRAERAETKIQKVHKEVVLSTPEDCYSYIAMKMMNDPGLMRECDRLTDLHYMSRFKNRRYIGMMNRRIRENVSPIHQTIFSQSTSISTSPLPVIW